VVRGLNAKLEIFSQPSEGTRVEVTAPIPPGLNLATLLKREWMYVSERVAHVETAQQSDSDSDR
jgi:hypothetical protein